MNTRLTKSWWRGLALAVSLGALFLVDWTVTEAVAQKAGARPVVPGVDDKITVRTMTVRLPAGTGWTKRLVPMPRGGVLYEFERELPNGNRLQIHIADYIGPNIKEYEQNMAGKTDTERLAVHVQALERVPMPDVRRTEWVHIVRGPQRRYGAVCRERHDIGEEKVAGKSYLWQDWMLLCIDPVCRIFFQVDYAERYPVGGAPSPTFGGDAARFYDSIEFRR